MGWLPDILGTLATMFRVGRATLDSSSLTANRTLSLPDASGTLLLSSSPVASILLADAVPTSITDTSTNAQILRSLVIPGGLLGPNDSLLLDLSFSLPAIAVTRTIQTRLGGYGGSILQFINISATGTTVYRVPVMITNRNSVSSQIGIADSANAGYGTQSVVSFLTSSVDMSVDQELVILGGFGTAGSGANRITLERIIVQLIRA